MALASCQPRLHSRLRWPLTRPVPKKHAVGFTRSQKAKHVLRSSGIGIGLSTPMRSGG